MRIARREVGIDLRFIFRHAQLAVVAVADAHKDPGRRFSQALRGVAGALNRLPGNLKQQALLGVHAHGLARRDTEELWLKRVNRLNEAAPARGDLARGIGVGVVIRAVVPSCRRDFGDGIHTVAQQCPIRLGRVSAGKAAGQTHNGNWLAARAFGCFQFCLQFNCQQGQAPGRERTDPLEKLLHGQAPVIFSASKRSTSSSERSSSESSMVLSALLSPVPTWPGAAVCSLALAAGSKSSSVAR